MLPIQEWLSLLPSPLYCLPMTTLKPQFNPPASSIKRDEPISQENTHLPTASSPPRVPGSALLRLRPHRPLPQEVPPTCCSKFANKLFGPALFPVGFTGSVKDVPGLNLHHVWNDSPLLKVFRRDKTNVTQNTSQKQPVRSPCSNVRPSSEISFNFSSSVVFLFLLWHAKSGVWNEKQMSALPLITYKACLQPLNDSISTTHW